MEQNNIAEAYDDIDQIVIDLLENKGYFGKDLLKKLQTIYASYHSSHIKEWIISDEDALITLKDIVWYNFEHKINDNTLGVASLKYLGSKFPMFASMFNDTNIIDYICLHALSEELNSIIDLWKKDTNIYIAELYSYDSIVLQGGESPTEIIIHMYNQHPKKYASDCVDATSVILNQHGEKFSKQKKLYGFCSLKGPITESDKLAKYFSLLLSLREVINTALEFKKDIKIIVSNAMTY